MGTNTLQKIAKIGSTWAESTERTIRLQTYNLRLYPIILKEKRRMLQLYYSFSRFLFQQLDDL